MHDEDSELDALLLAQSSDDDDSDIAELERDILDRIIDSTDLENDIPFSSILASSEGFAPFLKGTPDSLEDDAVANRWSPSLSIAPSLDTLEMPRLFKDGHDEYVLENQSRYSSDPQISAAVRVNVKSNNDVEACQVPGTMSNIGVRHALGSRAGARPGTALAAAMAASRQMASLSSSPISRSRRTKSMDIGVPITSSSRQLHSEDSALSLSLSSCSTLGADPYLRAVGRSQERPSIDLKGIEVEQETVAQTSKRFLTDTKDLTNSSSSQGGSGTSSFLEEPNAMNATPGVSLPARSSSLEPSSGQELINVSSFEIIEQADVPISLNSTNNGCANTGSIEVNIVVGSDFLQDRDSISIRSVSNSRRGLAHSGMAMHDNPVAHIHDEPVEVSVLDHGLHDLKMRNPTMTEERKSFNFKSMESLESRDQISHLEPYREVEDYQQSALDLAEEQERRAATAGVHWEKGAAAQPMRLDGIKRGRSEIGLLHVDCTGSLSQALGSAAMMNEYGFPQALAVHANFIAIGMSRGAVFVTPSKYSATRAADDTNAKAYLLRGLPDKVQTGVSAVCFNEQGGFLLVGYASGTVGLWDVTKARLNMSIVGEHCGAIVHAFFLTQDVADVHNMKAITADCTGRVMLHSFTYRQLLRRYALESKYVDVGQEIGLVVAITSLLPEDTYQSARSMSSVLETDKIAQSPDLCHSSMQSSAIPPIVGTSGIIVIVTYSRIVVACLFPTFSPLATLVRPEGIREGAIPYTSWQHSMKTDVANINAEHGEMIKDEEGPTLAVAWDRKVIVAHLRSTELRVDAKWDLDCATAGITWLEDKVLVVVTVKGQLYVFRKDGVEVEHATLMGDQGGIGALMYHTHFLNAFENPEKAYHNSLGVRGAALYMLGPVQLWRARLLPWFDRLKLLKGAGDWMEAFRFAIELYDGHAEGVTGLPRGLIAMREAIVDTLLGLLLSYLDEVFAYLSLALGSSPITFLDDHESQFNIQPEESAHRRTGIETWGRANLGLDMVAEADEHYARIGSMAIEFCVHIGKKEVVFENVYSRFEAVGQKDTFLELLEPYILNDTLGGLAPEVMQSFVEHYNQRGWLGKVEQCVLHMDMSSLDFNQVVRLCREHSLYSALIYLFNTGLDDFISPLEELLIAVQNSVDPIYSKTFGYKLLVYLKYCFTGLAFPLGQGKLATYRLLTLRAELLQFLLEQQGTPWRDLGSISDDEPCILYPRLFCLLKFDTQATLMVLRFAFPTDGALSIGKQGCAFFDAVDSDNTVDTSMTTEASDAAGNFLVVDDGIRYLQAIVHAAIQILEVTTKVKSLEDDDTVPIWPSAENEGFVLEFVAEFVASRHVVVGCATLKRIIEYLTLPSTNKESDNGKEELLTKVLSCVPKSDWDLTHTLDLAQRAGFWQVSGWLYTGCHLYIPALDCYLKGRSRQQKLFTFVMQALDQSDGLKGLMLAEFQEAVFIRLCKLVEHSSKGTLWVVLSHFSSSFERVVKKLRTVPRHLFSFLKELMEALWGIPSCSVLRLEGVDTIPHTVNGAESVSNSLEMDTETQNTGKLCFLWEPPIKIDKLLQQSGFECTDEITEQYLQLLCKFEPQSVMIFLARSENYRLENCLKICQDYGITNATILLLERAGDVSGALALILNDMRKFMHQVLQALSSLEMDSSMRNFSLYKVPEAVDCQSAVFAAVALCQRNTRRLSAEEADSLWFCLLDSIVEPLHELTAALLADNNSSNASTFTGKSLWRLEENKFRDESPLQLTMINSKRWELMRIWLVGMVGNIVSSMQDFVPPPILLRKILSEYADHPWGDFRATISNMLSAYRYEFAILGRAKQLVDETVYYNFHTLLKGHTHAYAPNDSSCCICNRELQDVHDLVDRIHFMPTTNDGENPIGNSDRRKPSPKEVNASLLLFSCGHAAHVYCLETYGLSEEREAEVTRCPVCLQKSMPTIEMFDRKKLFPYRKLEIPVRTHRSSKVDLREDNKRLTNSAGRRSKSQLDLLNQMWDGKGLQKVGPRLHLPLAPPKKPRNFSSQLDNSAFGHEKPMRRVPLVP